MDREDWPFRSGIVHCLLLLAAFFEIIFLYNCEQINSAVWESLEGCFCFCPIVFCSDALFPSSARCRMGSLSPKDLVVSLQIVILKGSSAVYSRVMSIENEQKPYNKISASEAPQYLALSSNYSENTETNDEIQLSYYFLAVNIISSS